MIEYLNITLIPTLLLNSSNGQINEIEVPEGAKDGFVTTKITDRAWTMEPHIKLLGNPRLRQKRVLPGIIKKFYSHNLRTKLY